MNILVAYKIQTCRHPTSIRSGPKFRTFLVIKKLFGTTDFLIDFRSPTIGTTVCAIFKYFRDPQAHNRVILNVCQVYPRLVKSGLVKTET